MREELAGGERRCMNHNPQYEAGYIKIATGNGDNDVLSALVRTDLSRSEYKVTLHILRKTWGFHKKEDWISYTQFQVATNLSRMTVFRAIEKLEQRKIIFTRKELGKTFYGINKRFSEWMGSIASDTSIVDDTSIAHDTRASNISGNSLVSPAILTKETLQKKTDKRKRVLFENLSSETTADPSSASLPDGQAGGPSLNSDGAGPAAAARMFDLFEQLSGRKVRIRDRTRMGHMKGRLKDFTEADLELAWRAMAKDASLRGDNKTGVDYFTIEYALRVQYIERYLDRAKKSGAAVNPDTGKVEKKPRVEMPPLRITRKDGTVVDEYPDGRCVVVSPSPKS